MNCPRCGKRAARSTKMVPGYEVYGCRDCDRYTMAATHSSAVQSSIWLPRVQSGFLHENHACGHAHPFDHRLSLWPPTAQFIVGHIRRPALVYELLDKTHHAPLG